MQLDLRHILKKHNSFFWSVLVAFELLSLTNVSDMSKKSSLTLNVGVKNLNWLLIGWKYGSRVHPKNVGGRKFFHTRTKVTLFFVTFYMYYFASLFTNLNSASNCTLFISTMIFSEKYFLILALFWNLNGTRTISDPHYQVVKIVLA